MCIKYVNLYTKFTFTGTCPVLTDFLLFLFKVPKHIMKGKDVTVEIGRKHLKVSCKAVEGHVVAVVDGDLIWECHKDECVWSLVPGEYVHVRKQF